MKKSTIFAVAASLAVSAHAQSNGTMVEVEGGGLQDTKTGLVWYRCTVGQTWTGSTCTGPQLQMSWYSAVVEAKKSKLLGHNDWRLPTLEELKQISNKSLFTVGRYSSYWSSDTDGNKSDHYNFGTGEVIDSPRWTSAGEVENIYGRNPDVQEYVPRSAHYALFVRGGDYSEFTQAQKLVENAYAELKTEERKQQQAKQAAAAKYEKERAEVKKEYDAINAVIAQFQKNLRRGDRAYQGLVLQVDGNMAKVQAVRCNDGTEVIENKCYRGYSQRIEKWVPRNKLSPM